LVVCSKLLLEHPWRCTPLPVSGTWPTGGRRALPTTGPGRAVTGLYATLCTP